MSTIEPFLIEQWYDRFEFTTEYMLSSSDCESGSVADLLALEPDAHARLQALRLGYTEARGSLELREAIAAQTERCTPDDVLVFAAAEEAIYVAERVLLGTGTHAIVESPCYQSALSVARATGASVTPWQRTFDTAWAHDLDALAAAFNARTRMVYVNSPHNPTGLQMEPATFEAIVATAAEREAVLFSDEVYRGLEHDPQARLPLACDLSPTAVSLGAPSKALGLPGLRLGWLVTRDRDLLARLADYKLYTTICSPSPSEQLVALALRHHDRLLARNRSLVTANLALVGGMVGSSELFDWVSPTAGPIGFPRVRGVADTRAWCERAAHEASVLLLPGDAYGCPAHVRLGFGRADLPQALERFTGWVREHPNVDD